MTSAAKSLRGYPVHCARHRARAVGNRSGARHSIDLVEALRSVGVFRLLWPRSHGGLELGIARSARGDRRVLKIEGSVGWIAMIACDTVACTSAAAETTIKSTETART